MAIFAVETEKDIKANEFMELSNNRLQSSNLVTNPFNGGIKKIEGNNKNTYLVYMQPIYPRLYIAGIFFLIITLVFTKFRLSLWLIPSILILCTGILWSGQFFYFILKKGLRKHGFTGAIKKLHSDDFNALVYKIM